MMKILCICQRGNSRSVALAYIFKDMKGYDAIAMGTETAAEDTRGMLYQWADKIIVVDRRLEDIVKSELKDVDKLMVWDVGPDRYFGGFHPELLAQLLQYYIDDDFLDNW